MINIERMTETITPREPVAGKAAITVPSPARNHGERAPPRNKAMPSNVIICTKAAVSRLTTLRTLSGVAITMTILVAISMIVQEDAWVAIAQILNGLRSNMLRSTAGRI